MNPKESTTYIVGSSDETSHYWQDLAVANRKVAEDNQTRLAAAIAQRDKAVADADHFFVLSGKYLQRANDAEAQRDKARNDALEQAAKVCEELRHPNWSDEDHAWIMGTEACAAAIRAMKVEK